MAFQLAQVLELSHHIVRGIADACVPRGFEAGGIVEIQFHQHPVPFRQVHHRVAPGVFVLPAFRLKFARLVHFRRRTFAVLVREFRLGGFVQFQSGDGLLQFPGGQRIGLCLDFILDFQHVGNLVVFVHGHRLDRHHVSAGQLHRFPGVDGAVRVRNRSVHRVVDHNVVVVQVVLSGFQPYLLPGFVRARRQVALRRLRGRHNDLVGAA